MTNREITHWIGRNLIERGIAECVSGRSNRGVAMFSQAYRQLSQACDPLADSALRLAAGWSQGFSIPLRHDLSVRAACFSPDGRTVLTASMDKTARLWDAATGQARGELLRHESWVTAVCFSPDGRTALTGSDDKTARLWDLPQPAAKDPQRAQLWSSVRTGWEVDENLLLRRIPVATWFQHWQSLAVSESSRLKALKTEVERTRVPWHRGQATEAELRG